MHQLCDHAPFAEAWERNWNRSRKSGQGDFFARCLVLLAFLPASPGRVAQIDCNAALCTRCLPHLQGWCPFSGGAASMHLSQERSWHFAPTLYSLQFLLKKSPSSRRLPRDLWSGNLDMLAVSIPRSVCSEGGFSLLRATGST